MAGGAQRLRDARPQRQEQGNIFGGKIHDAYGNLVALFHPGNPDLVQLGVEVVAGGNCQAGPPLEIHPIQALGLGSIPVLTGQDHFRPAGTLPLEIQAHKQPDGSLEGLVQGERSGAALFTQGFTGRAGVGFPVTVVIETSLCIPTLFGQAA